MGGSEIKRKIDWSLVATWLVLVLLGWINIYASVHSATSPDLISRPDKQLVWIGTALVLAVFVLFIFKPRLWGVVSTPGYLLVVFLLIAVIFLGTDIKGSRSWLTFGPISFQPAEISKITTSLALASLMSQSNFKLNTFRSWLFTIAIIAIPALAILLEKETGSMLVYAGFLFVLYREGMSGWILGFIFLSILLFIFTLTSPVWVPFVVLAVCISIFFISKLVQSKRSRRRKAKINRIVVTSLLSLAAGAAIIFMSDFAFNHILQDHQRGRIEVLLGLKEDPSGAGYNVNQSMIAIGSGGFLGKGYLQGTQTTYGFVPEQSTDFIFCTVGEEWGFIGCLIVIALYTFLIGRIIVDAENCREKFSRIYGYCVASCFFMHLIINVGMTIGLMPVIGIPLPFLSYGGSSLWGFTVLLFIFIALHRHENY